MKFLTGLIFAAVSTSAVAADLAPMKAPLLAPVPVSSWTGFYLGANAGYATGKWEGQYTFNGLPDTNIPGTHSPGVNGAFAGVQFGYNWEGFLMPKMVLGIEADFDGASLGGTDQFVVGMLPGNTWTKTYSTSVDFFGTVRGRLGYDLGGFLLYGTGGFAYARDNSNETVDFLQSRSGLHEISTAFADGIRTGWAAGAGFEYALDPHLSVKAEYLHLDLGKQATHFVGVTSQSPIANGVPVFTTDGYDATLKFDTFKAGMNYRF